MIKVKIKDFQSIGNMDFEIDGFTVIVGKNNLGKSAMVRAIDAALTNRPGNEFIRNGKKSTEVSIIKDDLDVLWNKGDSATYKVNGKPYSKLNRAVPEPILEAGIKKIEIGDFKLNPLIAHQLQGELFLLNETGSTITDVLSVIYKLNVLSDADTLCNKELRSSKIYFKTRKNDLEILQTKFEKYKDLESIRPLLERAKKLRARTTCLNNEIAEITCYMTEIENLTESLKSFKKLSDIKIPPYKNMEKQLQNFLFINDAYEKLNKLASTVQGLKKLHNIEIPQYKNIEPLLDTIIWMNGIYSKYHLSNLSVNKLKITESINIPEYLSIKNRIDELKEILELTNSFNDTTEKIRKLVSLNKIKALKNSLVLIDSIEEKIKETVIFDQWVKTIVTTKKEFFSLATQKKDIDKAIEENKTELDTFKICPACGGNL